MSDRFALVAGLMLMLPATAPAAWSQQLEVKKITFRAVASVNGKDRYKAYCV